MDIRKVALGLGIIYLAVGLIGFIPGILVEPPLNAPPVRVTSFYGYLLGLFPVNLLHTLFHLGIGIWGISIAKNEWRSIWYLRSLAVIYGVLTIFGLIPGLNTVFGLLPLHGHDVWLHALTALVAGYFGFIMASDKMPIKRKPHDTVLHNK